MLRWNVLTYSGSKINQVRDRRVAGGSPEDGENTFLRNFGSHRTTKGYIPEIGNIHDYLCENLKFHINNYYYLFELEMEIYPVAVLLQ
jgi:hypothetical protein